MDIDNHVVRALAPLFIRHHQMEDMATQRQCNLQGFTRTDKGFLLKLIVGHDCGKARIGRARVE